MKLTLDDLNNFITIPVTVKSSDLRSCLATEKHSSAYNKIGIHYWLLNGCFFGCNPNRFFSKNGIGRTIKRSFCMGDINIDLSLASNAVTFTCGRIDLSGQSVHRFGGASFFAVKIITFFSCRCFNLYTLAQLQFSTFAFFTFALWWSLQCSGASCARAHCAHWIIRPCTFTCIEPTAAFCGSQYSL